MDYNNPLSPFGQIHHDDKMYDELTYEEKMKAGCLHLFIVILMFFVGIVACLLFGSCTTTKYVTVPEYHTDTLYQNHVQHDSIHVRDSVYFREYVKGDTIYKEKTRWLTEWRERLKIDTIYKSKTDSVPVPYPVEVKVPAELSRWQSFRITIGEIALFLIAAIGGYIILKKIKS
jgi:hypothetical protein